MSLTDGLRGSAGYLPSWVLECGGNPSLNQILDAIDGATTMDIEESGDRLYYTEERVAEYLAEHLADTDDLPEGATNLYYTDERVEEYINENLSDYLEQQLGFISVRDFGAVGDGVTDDTAAFQAAADSNHPGILIPGSASGDTYMLSDLILLSSNKKWVGINNPTVKIEDNTVVSNNIYGLFVAEGSPTENIEFHNITFDGNRENNVDHGTPDGAGNQSPAHGGSPLAILNLRRTNNVRITGCTFNNCWNSAIWLTGCQQVHVEGNIVNDFRIHGVSIRKDIDNNTPCAHVVVANNIIHNGGVGIEVIFGCHHVAVVNNTVYDCREENRFPAFAYSGTYPNVWPSTGGFTAFGSPGYVSPVLPGDGCGIEATGFDTAPSATQDFNIAFTGNVCYDNANGIRVEQESHHVNVTGNNCFDNDLYGILVFSARFNVVSGNSSSGNLDGIRVEKLADAIVTGAYTADQNTITGNQVSGNEQWGIVLKGGRGNVVSGNNISGNNTNTGLDGGGISLQYGPDSTEVSRAVITGNNITSYNGQDKYGIHNDNALNVTNTILGNVFLGETVAAIYGFDDDLNNIDHNEGYVTQRMVGPQLLVNGNFDIWQRNTTFTFNDDTYGPDRWNLLTETNGAWTVARDTDTPAKGRSRYSAKFTNVTLNNQCAIVQIIEAADAIKLRGKNASISFYAKTVSSEISNLRATLLSWDGTADAVTSDVIATWAQNGTDPTFATNWTKELNGTNLALSNSWQRFHVDGIPMDTANFNNIALIIWVDDGTIAANDDFWISDVVVNQGDFANAQPPRTFQDELQRCLRFYEKSYNYSVVPGTSSTPGLREFFVNGGVAFAVAVDFEVRKRGTPSITIYPSDGSPAGSFTQWDGGSETENSTTPDRIGETGFRIADAAGAGVFDIYFHYVADAEL